MQKKYQFFILLVFALFSSQAVFAQENENQFRQLHQKLPAPNVYRTASGQPGPEYWQQRADYDIAVKLDENKKCIYGKETITYFNNSPEPLSYLWLQLDQNVREKNSLAQKTQTGQISDEMSIRRLKRLHIDFEGGFKIQHVKDKNGKDLHFKIVDTMMRVDLPEILKPNSKYSFKIKWWYNINDQSKVRGRSGYRYSEKDSSYVYAIAQFFPRMAVYDEVKGWRHKQFLGSGEFALPFGNYEVKLTVPADHIVGATGVLQNEGEMLTRNQRKQLSKAWQKTDNTVIIVSEEEAVENGKAETDKEKTWVFKAENVRDFAFASSRNFIWDAMAVKFKNHTSLAMSFYTAEGNPLWEKFSTKALAHAMRVYSKYLFDYPYPKAVSVMTGSGGGMEYPMLAFNGGKPNPDGTYSERTKFGLIGLIIHEFGHNFFPMVVNSDERQWGWMDEGMNTFVEYLVEQEWQRDFPSRSGPAYTVAGRSNFFRFSDTQSTPIMTACDIDPQYTHNAYSKASAGLNILRETIMGRELFDFAFKKYAQRWKFKHPTPSDFFRTMEDASGMDLDWFWREWFFSTDNVDIAIDNVKWYKIKKSDQDEKSSPNNSYISNIRNKKSITTTAVENDTLLLDKYNEKGQKGRDEIKYEKLLKSLTDEEKELINADYNYYQINFSTNEGMVMPVILKFEYFDGSNEVKRIPVEIWRKNNQNVSKVFVSKKKIKSITLDPFLETADSDVSNNNWTIRGKPDYITLSKNGRFSRNFIMRQMQGG